MLLGHILGPLTILTTLGPLTNDAGMPCAQAKKPKGIEKWFNILLMVFYGVAGILAAIGSVHNIVKHADEYHSVG